MMTSILGGEGGGAGAAAAPFQIVRTGELPDGAGAGAVAFTSASAAAPADDGFGGLGMDFGDPLPPSTSAPAPAPASAPAPALAPASAPAPPAPPTGGGFYDTFFSFSAPKRSWSEANGDAAADARRRPPSERERRRRARDMRRSLKKWVELQLVDAKEIGDVDQLDDEQLEELYEEHEALNNHHEVAGFMVEVASNAMNTVEYTGPSIGQDFSGLHFTFERSRNHLQHEMYDWVSRDLPHLRVPPFVKIGYMLTSMIAGVWSANARAKIDRDSVPASVEHSMHQHMFGGAAGGADIAAAAAAAAAGVPARSPADAANALLQPRPSLGPPLFSQSRGV